MCSSPKESIRTATVVLKVLDEESGLVQGVDEAAHAVMVIVERSDVKAAMRRSYKEE